MVTKTALASAAVSAALLLAERLWRANAWMRSRPADADVRRGGEFPRLLAKDERGRWVGFDADICRSVAAALFGNAEKVTFKPIDTLPNFLADPTIDFVCAG